MITFSCRFFQVFAEKQCFSNPHPHPQDEMLDIDPADLNVLSHV
jgi:hypothetical protein